jgi:hypothetical protein
MYLYCSQKYDKDFYFYDVLVNKMEEM